MQDLQLTELLNTFDHHTPNQLQIEKILLIREEFKDLVETIYEVCPASADRTVCFRKLHEAMMTANKSIVLEKK